MIFSLLVNPTLRADESVTEIVDMFVFGNVFHKNLFFNVAIATI